MNKHWYMRGIRKVAGLHKQALLPGNDTAQQQPVYPDFRTYADPGFNTRSAPLKRFFYKFMPAGAPDPNTGLTRDQWSQGYDLFKGRTSPLNLLGFKFNPKQMSDQLKQMRFKNYVPQYISYIKQNPTTDMQQRAAARDWMKKNIDSTPQIPFVDTAENRAARSTAIDSNITKLQQHLKSGQFDPNYVAEVQQSIDLLQQQKNTNDTTAFQQIGPDGSVTWQSNLKAPELTEAEKREPTYTQTTTSKQHSDAIASGKGVAMTGGDAAKVRSGYNNRLQQIAKSRAAIKSGDTNALIAMSGGALSPMRKIMDPDSYQQAKETYSPQALDKQEAQIRENMKRLGRSSDQVRADRASGSDAKAYQNYARLTQQANDSIQPKKQKPATPTAPTQAQAQPTAATGTAPNAAPTQAPAAKPGIRPAATGTAQPGTSSTAPGTAQPQTTVAQPPTSPKPAPKPNYATRDISKTYDTTIATDGHASYTRNGITYLHFNNAADAQKALGTNNVMAMTRGTGKNKKQYWARVDAKSTRSMGSYASTPGTVNNTRPKSPNIMRPYGMRGNKNGWKSAT